jgi:sigma-B regulation protein RsbU (phosphoserine phosphatase)
MEQPTSLTEARSSYPIRDAALRNQLLARRDRIHSALPAAHTQHLEQLLHEVDDALDRMEAGTYGICETCQDSIEGDRLLLDPLTRNCLDHLSPAERRALEVDLDLALQVQQGLLPSPDLTIDGWSMAYTYRPAGPVSGDYCDLLPLGGGTGLFLLGDVSGKGVAASMLMAQLHAIFRSLATITPSVTELVAKANRVFCQGNPTCHFATLVCGHLGAGGGLEICNAGHCPPLRVARGEVTRIDSTGLPVGVICDGEYPCQERSLAPGDSLVLYTDGLSEALSASGEQYGIDRLAKLLSRDVDLSAKDLLKTVLDDLTRFRSGAPQTDDLTIMILQRADGSSSPAS